MKKNILLLLSILFTTVLSAQTEKDSVILEFTKTYNVEGYFVDLLNQTLKGYADNLPHINATYWENIPKSFYPDAVKKVRKEMIQLCNKEMEIEDIKALNKAMQSNKQIAENLWESLRPVSIKLTGFIKNLISIKLYQDLSYKGLIPKLNDPSICRELHDGHFLNISRTLQDTVYISRKGNKQVEKFKGGTAVFNVVWQDDATYTLTIFETDDPMMASLKEKDQGLTAEIIEITDEFYRCIYYDFMEGWKYYDLVTIYFQKESKNLD